MKYVITGSIGNISRPLAQKLVKAGHDVSVISSKAERKAEIESLGAKALIGSVTDVAFLTAAFRGADAVYSMIPPNFAASDWKGFIAATGKNYAKAIKESGVKYVVNLSSIGAHMPDGCGPVSGLFYVEAALDELENVHVKHLRPGFFYYNFFGNIGMIKHMGIIGGNYGKDTRMVLVDTNDIAEVAADELLQLAFTGKSVRYIISDEKSTHEIASSLGHAIGKPDLKWVDFTDEQTFQGLVQAGLPDEIAKNYAEMGGALRSGQMVADYVAVNNKTIGKTKFESFAKQFAYAYNQ